MLKYKKLQLNLLQDIQVISISVFLSLSPKLEDTTLPSTIQLLTMMQTSTLLIISYLVPSAPVSIFEDINPFGRLSVIETNTRLFSTSCIFE